MIIFSGSSNQPLTEEIAGILKLNVSPSEVVRFADGEVRVRITDDLKDQHAVIVQSLSTPCDSNLMEICQFAHIAKREKAKKVTAVIPYLAYARQHKAHREGEAISVKLVADFLKTSGVDECILLDIHEENAVRFFKMPTVHLSASDIFAEYIDAHREDFGEDNLIIIAPDKGRRSEAENLAGDLEVGFAVIDKVRFLDRTDEIDKNELNGDVNQKEALIFDDMISTGRTAIKAAEVCLKGGAFHAYLIASHGVFSINDPSIWDKAPIEKVFVTNSINIPLNKRFPKLETVSVAPLIAKTLQNYV